MKYFPHIIIAIVAVAIIGAFFVAGSPMEQRLIRFDNDRVGDLQSIQWQIVNYFEAKGNVPDALSQLQDNIGGFVVPRDPETDQSYRYQKKSNTSFMLCATFNRAGEAEKGTTPYPLEPGMQMEIWNHGAGEVCFDRTIDPELYPVRPQPTPSKIIR